MQPDRTTVSPQFTDIFLKKLGLSDDEFSQVLGKFNFVSVPKKFFYLKAGQAGDHKAYINRGSARVFTVDSKAREHILHFAFEDWWLGDFESYYSGNPATIYVQATEDCELLCIKKHDLQTLEENIPKIKQLFEEKKQKMIYATLNRLNEVKTLSVEERYLNLTKKHPEIFQRIPLQDIASFLDIEPQSLSRLRKRLSQK